jgi:hypothetical protein
MKKHELLLESGPPGAAAPPHPFRASPWYDPALHQRQVTAVRRPRRRIGAAVLVVLGGVALPLCALAFNEILEQVVALGPFGIAALVLSVAFTLGNLVLLPTRRAPSGRIVLARTPRSTWVRVLLLSGALLSGVCWGYLALLLLPLVPISTVAILLLGIGLCGLSPYPALAISIVQAIRAGRVVRQRLSLQGTVTVIVASLLTPVVLAGGLGVYAAARHARFEESVRRVAGTAPFSAERMEAIQKLRGDEDRVVAAYNRAETWDQQRILATIYHRLTDHPLKSEDSYRLFRYGAMVRPWWFVEDRSPFGFAPLEPTQKILRELGGL